MLIPARYEGMDARVEQEYADELVSMGDFVLMSGDLPAMMFLEGLLRLIPGVVGKQESVEKESFSGPFLDHPEYAEPVEWHGMSVPDIVRSGNHAAIETWRTQQAVKKTVVHHFDWLRSYPELADEQKKMAKEAMPHHYLALCHSEVYIGEGENKTSGTTSVTSIDIHDIARSCKTYGVEEFSVVTPLNDQQRIVRTLLDFWQVGHGLEYNRSRYDAIKSVSLKASVDEVVAQIESKHGVKPLIIATSARSVANENQISFYDQGVVWCQDRPILMVFGTGKGFTQKFLDRCDYVLMPVEGFSEFNHLSVRSAVAIILDRWMGINKKKSALEWLLFKNWAIVNQYTNDIKLNSYVRKAS